MACRTKKASALSRQIFHLFPECFALEANFGTLRKLVNSWPKMASNRENSNSSKCLPNMFLTSTEQMTQIQFQPLKDYSLEVTAKIQSVESPARHLTPLLWYLSASLPRKLLLSMSPKVNITFSFTWKMATFIQLETPRASLLHKIPIEQEKSEVELNPFKQGGTQLGGSASTVLPESRPNDVFKQAHSNEQLVQTGVVIDFLELGIPFDDN
ncbi:Hypothetical_protein [Hexamita inflata]|uniref:Hypothetical_protein n=1 Tax=Hexamita inflata TaxID=28002 RepID=A0AA86PL13_9EUKA|nr:Hypothetical protein HINF_LOCUS25135 [Hexamita inflata]